MSAPGMAAEVERQMLQAEAAGLVLRVTDAAGKIIGWQLTEAGRRVAAGERN